jgi:tetratricopeptide (TPR) repeat protein
MEQAKATYDRAIALAFKALNVNPRSAITMGSLALYYAKKGDMGQATAWIQRARGLDRSSVELIQTSAEIHALSGKSKDAIADLKKGLQHGLTTNSIESDPELDSLRKRPDYQALMSQFAPRKK